MFPVAYGIQQEVTKPVVAAAVVGIVSLNRRVCAGSAGYSMTRQPTMPCSGS